MQSISTKWSKVVTLDSNCLQYTLDNLREKSEYSFAVYAENSVAISPAAITGNVILNANASKFSNITVNNTELTIYISLRCTISAYWTIRNSCFINEYYCYRMGHSRV